MRRTTKLLMTGVLTALVTLGTAGCASVAVPDHTSVATVAPPNRPDLSSLKIGQTITRDRALQIRHSDPFNRKSNLQAFSTDTQHWSVVDVTKPLTPGQHAALVNEVRGRAKLPAHPSITQVKDQNTALTDASSLTSYQSGKRTVIVAPTLIPTWTNSAEPVMVHAYVIRTVWTSLDAKDQIKSVLQQHYATASEAKLAATARIKKLADATRYEVLVLGNNPDIPTVAGNTINVTDTVTMACNGNTYGDSSGAHTTSGDTATSGYVTNGPNITSITPSQVSYGAHYYTLPARSYKGRCVGPANGAAVQYSADKTDTGTAVQVQRSYPVTPVDDLNISFTWARTSDASGANIRVTFSTVAYGSHYNYGGYLISGTLQEYDFDDQTAASGGTYFIGTRCAVPGGVSSAGAYAQVFNPDGGTAGEATVSNTLPNSSTLVCS